MILDNAQHGREDRACVFDVGQTLCQSSTHWIHCRCSYFFFSGNAMLKVLVIPSTVRRSPFPRGIPAACCSSVLGPSTSTGLEACTCYSVRKLFLLLLQICLLLSSCLCYCCRQWANCLHWYFCCHRFCCERSYDLSLNFIRAGLARSASR